MPKVTLQVSGTVKIQTPPPINASGLDSLISLLVGDHCHLMNIHVCQPVCVCVCVCVCVRQSSDGERERKREDILKGHGRSNSLPKARGW